MAIFVTIAIAAFIVVAGAFSPRASCSRSSWHSGPYDDDCLVELLPDVIPAKAGIH
jgi:hypothetical protein